MLATGFHSVPKSSESETALFPRQKKSNPPPDFSSKKNDPHAIFIAFLCDNFSQSNSKLQKNSKSNTFARFYLPSGLKSTRPTQRAVVVLFQMFRHWYFFFCMLSKER